MSHMGFEPRANQTHTRYLTTRLPSLDPSNDIFSIYPVINIFAPSKSSPAPPPTTTLPSTTTCSPPPPAPPPAASHLHLVPRTCAFKPPCSTACTPPPPSPPLSNTCCCAPPPSPPLLLLLA